MKAIETLRLRKEYRGTVAVEGLDLSVERGELISLLGLNGAGKTTTIRMLACLTRPTGGDALLNGRSVLRDPAAVKAMIGISPQETAVAPGLTVEENLRLMCGAHGVPRERRAERARALARRLGLEEVSGRRAGKLSGGWRRRLSIAMALVGEPQILFLDEPTLGLDVLARRELWALIRELKGSATIVLTTHALEEAEALSDRVAILQGGRLLICDSVENIKAAAGAEQFEQAFVRLAKGDAR